ncbi:MAG: CBS domain-containing protein [Promethearchaeota archaeon]
MFDVLNLPALDIANKNPVTVKKGTDICDAAKKIMETNASYLIVIDDNYSKPIGIVTERDFTNLIAINKLESLKHVESIMSKPLLYVDVSAKINEVVDLMNKNGIKHVPIIDDRETLLGVVTLKELIANNSPVIVETHPIVLYTIFNKNGLLIYEYKFKNAHERKSISGDLFSGVLSSLDSLFAEILGSKQKLNLIEIEDIKILIEHGTYITAIMVQDQESIDSRKRLKAFKNAFEKKFKEVLENFNESIPVNVFNDAEILVEEIFASKINK